MRVLELYRLIPKDIIGTLYHNMKKIKGDEKHGSKTKPVLSPKIKIIFM
jgi:hypothetical protein